MVLKLKRMQQNSEEVWEWCKNVWYSNQGFSKLLGIPFENDVKMYGTQTSGDSSGGCDVFENDVKMYGTQTCVESISFLIAFENDVKMYGTQTFT